MTRVQIEKAAKNYIDDFLNDHIDYDAVNYEEDNYEAGRNNALCEFGVDIFKELAQIVELAVVVQFIKVIIEIPVPAVYGVVFVCILLYNSLYAGKWLIFLRLNQPVCVLQKSEWKERHCHGE